MPDPASNQITEIVRMLTHMAQGDSLIGVDLADIRTVLREGRAPGTVSGYGVGEASGPSGPGRGIEAARRAMADLRRNLAASGPCADVVPAVGIEPTT